jgi:hypothetical protein
MNAYRKLVLSTLFFAALAIVLCSKPFAIALQAQSPQAAAPAPLHAFPDGGAQPVGAPSSGLRWPDPRAVAHRSPDIQCAFVQWTAEPPRPALVVVCPPEEVFAPLRLYFKLSWKRDADVPANFQALLTQPKTQTKMHWTPQGDYHVLLQAERKNGRSAHLEWVHFTDLVGVYIKD